MNFHSISQLEFTQWTRIDIRKPDCTLKELIALFEKEHGIDALILRFQEYGLPRWMHPDRPNTCLPEVK